MFFIKNRSFVCKMSSTASSIDRSKSNLRTHQILALSTHLITHKSTISGVSSTNRAVMGKQFRANVTWVLPFGPVWPNYIGRFRQEHCWERNHLNLINYFNDQFLFTLLAKRMKKGASFINNVCGLKQDCVKLWIEMCFYLQ